MLIFGAASFRIYALAGSHTRAASSVHRKVINRRLG
jgi:hypothetical protein